MRRCADGLNSFATRHCMVSSTMTVSASFFIPLPLVCLFFTCVVFSYCPSARRASCVLALEWFSGYKIEPPPKFTSSCARVSRPMQFFPAERYWITGTLILVPPLFSFFVNKIHCLTLQRRIFHSDKFKTASLQEQARGIAQWCTAHCE